jgi:acyl-CoA thioester hydrolase
MARETPSRERYRHFLLIPTRWMDNDIYGHVNNAVYYSYFDTVINQYLIEQGGLDIARDPIIGLCVESHCAYARPITFPGAIDGGLAVAHVGRSSVRYEIGIFALGETDASAHGWFVHVFVDRTTRRSAPLPEGIRAAVEKLVG